MNTSMNWVVSWRMEGEYDSTREEFPDFEDALERYQEVSSNHDVKRVDLQQVLIIGHRSTRCA